MSYTMHASRRERRLRDLAARVRTLNARMWALLMHTAATQAAWSATLQRNLDRGRRI
jgi:hypothetical protein